MYEIAFLVVLLICGGGLAWQSYRLGPYKSMVSISQVREKLNQKGRKNE